MLHSRPCTCDIDDLVGFGQMVLEVNRTVAQHAVLIEGCGRNQPFLVDDSVGLDNHLWLCVQGMQDNHDDETCLEAEEKVFDGLICLPGGAPVPLADPLLGWGGLALLDTDSVGIIAPLQ